MTFVVDFSLGLTTQEVIARPLALIAGSSLFTIGIWLGLRSSGRFIRHGIASVRSLDLLWVETGASVTVLSGAALGVPPSMTQSLAGTIAGVGASRSKRAICWDSSGRIAMAWAWTLPVSRRLALAEEAPDGMVKEAILRSVPGGYDPLLVG